MLFVSLGAAVYFYYQLRDTIQMANLFAIYIPTPLSTVEGSTVIFKCLLGEPFVYIDLLSTQWIHRYGLCWITVEVYIHMSKEPS